MPRGVKGSSRPTKLGKRAATARLGLAVHEFLKLKTTREGMVPADDPAITELIQAFDEWNAVVPLEPFS